MLLMGHLWRHPETTLPKACRPCRNSSLQCKRSDDYALTFPSTTVSATFVPDSADYSDSPAVEVSLLVSQLKVDVIPDGSQSFLVKRFQL